MLMSGGGPHPFLIHDRDSIYSAEVNRTISGMGVMILKTPVRTPRAHAFCVRLIGTMRRECLDWVIPLNEAHLQRILREWVAHYNRGRPHASLGPGMPDGAPVAEVSQGHRMPDGYRIVTKSVLGALHHEYRLVGITA
jgi:transposase InsO family protein